MRTPSLKYVVVAVGIAAIGLATIAVLSPAPPRATAQQASEADWKAVEQALGKSGQLQPGGVFRIAMPRTDLKVKVQGVDVKPGFALGSYAAFKKMGNDAMVMGDLVLLDEEVQNVMARLLAKGIAITGDFVLIDREVTAVAKALRDNGIQVTALHNHGLDDNPRLLYMHFWANDDALKLARGLKAALDLTNSKKP